MNISNLEKQVLEILYGDYKKTGQVKHWKLPESFELFGIKDGQYVGTLNDSVYIGKSSSGSDEEWFITNEGIRFMDSLETSETKKVWKTKSKDCKYWANAQQDGTNVHIFVGEQGEKDKVHIINDLITGETRIDKKDKDPSDLVDEITTYIRLKDSVGKVVKVVKGKISFENDPNQVTFTIIPELLRINVKEEVSQVEDKLKNLEQELSNPKLDGNIELSKAISGINPNFFQPTRETLQDYGKDLEEYKNYLISLSQEILFMRCNIDISKYDEKVDISLELEGANLESGSTVKFQEMPQEPSSGLQNLINNSRYTQMVPFKSQSQSNEPPYRTNLYLKDRSFGCTLRYIKPKQIPGILPFGAVLKEAKLPIVIKGSVNSQNSNGDFSIKLEINQDEIKEIAYKDLKEWLD